jgi:hypothetical protein
MKDEKSAVVTGCLSVLVWGETITSRYSIYMDLVVRQREIHTAEPLVPELSAFKFEMAIENLRSHKSPGIEQIPAELIKAGGRTIHSEIHKLINSIRN